MCYTFWTLKPVQCLWYSNSFPSLKDEFHMVYLEFHPSFSPASIPTRPLCFRHTILLFLSLILHMKISSRPYWSEIIHKSHLSLLIFYISVPILLSRCRFNAIFCKASPKTICPKNDQGYVSNAHHMLFSTLFILVCVPFLSNLTGKNINISDFINSIS